MRAVLVALTLALLGFLACTAWHVHVASLRATADEPWTAPPHVWSCRTPSVVAEEPGGAPLSVALVGGLCGNEARDERECILVAPSQRAAAREKLGLDSYEPEWAYYELSDVRRMVAGVEWARWDAVR